MLLVLAHLAKANLDGRRACLGNRDQILSALDADPEPTSPEVADAD